MNCESRGEIDHFQTEMDKYVNIFTSIKENCENFISQRNGGVFQFIPGDKTSNITDVAHEDIITFDDTIDLDVSNSNSNDTNTFYSPNIKI